MNIVKATVSASIFVVAMAGAASAVTIANGGKSVDITCTGSCAFWDLGSDPDAFSATSGAWLSSSDLGISMGNSNSNRLNGVNNVLGTTFTRQSESSDDISGVPDVSGFNGDGDSVQDGWTGSAEFYLAWGGFNPRYVLIKNNSVDNMFEWTPGAGAGSGLSGVDGFGAVAPIPLPAAGWLMLAALGGLAALRRRKTA